MATFSLRARRLVVAGGFAVAIAIAPVIAVAAGSGAARPVADDCANGESMDVYSMACVPDVVPNTGAPSENALTQCSGGDQGQCIANEYYGPGNVQVPNVSTRVQQSP
ncbi:intersectin-EH binding protein Ibp1 [Mycobacterium sp.]|uniref:intersectin-EH binding protein Ibp1 n=1 Tax=Mycobacterium sp. TaxID=1785 RepID=UPI002C322E80|nr:intersectin-EH binding protein Ibp1 [Mycobacterium sp.]HME50025.1 intersectin-EH binding protein Ibp1 [Mycobacterium sp.]